MCEAEPLCAENVGLKDIARNRRGELISRGELIMYYRSTLYIVASLGFAVSSQELAIQNLCKT